MAPFFLCLPNCEAFCSNIVILLPRSQSAICPKTEQSNPAGAPLATRGKYKLKQIKSCFNLPCNVETCSDKYAPMGFNLNNAILFVLRLKISQNWSAVQIKMWNINHLIGLEYYPLLPLCIFLQMRYAYMHSPEILLSS